MRRFVHLSAALVLFTGLTSIAAIGPLASSALAASPTVTISCTTPDSCTVHGSGFTPSGTVLAQGYASSTLFSSSYLTASPAQKVCTGGLHPYCYWVGGFINARLPVDTGLACGATAAGTARYTDETTGLAASAPVTWVGPCLTPTTTTLVMPTTVDTGWTGFANVSVAAGSTYVSSGTVTITVNGVTFCSYPASGAGCTLANLPAGTDHVQAAYSGSSAPPYEPSSASATVTVLPTNPSVPQMSQNWAGYEATGDTFNSVSANWTVPAANCGIGEVSVSATWVGIDGDPNANDNTGPEQIGTDSNCGTFTLPGTSIYWAWWQMNQPGLKGWPHFIGGPGAGSYPVAAGDLMTATVKSTGVPGQYTMTLEDHTQGDWTYSTTQTNPAATGMTAECIEEQPAVLGLPLTNFGSVHFSQCQTAGSNGVATPIWDHPNNDITMTDASGTTTKASVSTPLSNDGTDFTVTWMHS
jgi:hypothetical protein